MQELIIAGKVVALVATCISGYFTFNNDYQKSSRAWNVTTLILWAISFAA
jgi:hypothetical protein